MNKIESTSSDSSPLIKPLMEEILKKGNLKHVLLVLRDGRLLSEAGEGGFNRVQFSAMCASVLGSAEDLGQTIGDSKTSKIITELEEQSIIIFKCSKKTFLVIIFKDDSKIDFITSNLNEYITKITTAIES